ncbi:MAG: TrkH family potassium uptake protein [Solirubrobacterales bacterium]
MSRPGSSLFAPIVGLAIGGTMIAGGGGMLICGLLGLADGRDAGPFLLTGAVVFGFGLALFLISRRAEAREQSVRTISGLLAVTLAWVVASLFGAVPFLLTGTFSAPMDAVFEAASGFTTTGATVIDDIEAQSDAVLLWRSITQWLGGIGIVVLVVAVAPQAGPGLQRAFYAETSGVGRERLTPRLIDTAKIIAGVYLTLSAVGAIAYLAAGMNLFDAINHSMTSLATGGFSTRNDSMASYGTAIQIVAIGGMLLGSINFAFYWLAIRRKRVTDLIPEIRTFLIIVAIMTVAIAVSLFLTEDVIDADRTVLDSAFTVVSIITTTGYTTVDFDNWDSFARASILLMTFIGACAGSTSGGIKVIRMMLLGKSAFQEIQLQVRPKAVRVLRIGKKVYGDDIRRAIFGYLTVYVIVYGAGVLAMTIGGLDVISAISASAATLNVTGPGIGEIGALENYGALSDFNLVVAWFLMIAGRLEVYTLVAVLVAIFDRVRQYAFSH